MKKPHKSKHNKKRNTAFLYEVLIQDITRSVMGGDQNRKEEALSICKEFFHKGSVLHAEKELYSTLLEANELDSELLQKVLAEAKKEYAQLNKKEIFNLQTKMINNINKRLTPSVFGNFVSNYKNLATISQILNQDLPVKERVLLENKFIKEGGPGAPLIRESLEPTDNLIYQTFVKTYNSKYENSLLEEQKEVITRHATRFSDNGLALKTFLNEEVARLKNRLQEAQQKTLVKEDEIMLQKTIEVIDILESLKDVTKLDTDDIVRILEIQSLVKEMES